MVRIESRILSPTAINMYLSCPRKFYLRYIKRLGTKPSIHLIRGSIVHRTLREFHKNFLRTMPGISLEKIRSDLLNIFNNEWEKAEYSLNSLGLTDAQIESFHDESELMLMNFSHWFFKNNLASPELSEARMFSKNLRLMGIVDAVHTSDDKVTLVDYKTSRDPKITNEIQRQASLYALLYEDRYKKAPDQVWIHFLKFPGDPLPIHIDDELMQYAKITLDSVHEKTTSRDEQDYPCKCGGYCEMDFID